MSEDDVRRSFYSDVDSPRLFVGRLPEPKFGADWEIRLGDQVLARLSDNGARMMAEHILRVLNEVKP